MSALRLMTWLASGLAVAGCAAPTDDAAPRPAEAVGPSAVGSEPPPREDARSPAGSVPDAPPAGRADRVRVARWTPTEVKMLALATGRLAVVDGCLGLAYETGESMVVAFPYDAGWDDRAQTLTFEGETYAVGDTVSLGGGSVEPGNHRLDAGPHDVPPCVTDRVFLTG